METKFRFIKPDDSGFKIAMLGVLFSQSEVVVIVIVTAIVVFLIVRRRKR